MTWSKALIEVLIFVASVVGFLGLLFLLIWLVIWLANPR